jgi:hypothetical protein
VPSLVRRPCLEGEDALLTGSTRVSTPCLSELAFASKITVSVANVRHIHTGLLTVSLEFQDIPTGMSDFAGMSSDRICGNALDGRYLHCCANQRRRCGQRMRKRRCGPLPSEADGVMGRT